MDHRDTFYRDHKGRLFSYPVRRSGDGELSRDLMQESFTRLFEKYPHDTANAALLFSIARNAFLDAMRKRRKNEEISESHPDPSANPESTTLIREEYRRVLAAMGKLDDDERDTLSLTIDGALSYREIADITGTSEANVKVRVHRARMKLKTLLRGEN